MDGDDCGGARIATGHRVVGEWPRPQDADQQVTPLVESWVGRECRDGRVVDLMLRGRDLDDGPLIPGAGLDGLNIAWPLLPPV